MGAFGRRWHRVGASLEIISLRCFAVDSGWPLRHQVNVSNILMFEQMYRFRRAALASGLTSTFDRTCRA
jgi:hypothetical protein